MTKKIVWNKLRDAHEPRLAQYIGRVLELAIKYGEKDSEVRFVWARLTSVTYQPNPKTTGYRLGFGPGYIDLDKCLHVAIEEDDA